MLLQYTQLKSTLSNMLKEKSLEQLLQKIVNAKALTASLNRIFEDEGRSKYAAKFDKIVISLTILETKLETKKLKKFADIREAVKKILQEVVELDPEAQEENPISTEDDTLKQLNLNDLKVSLPIVKDKSLMSLGHAPMFLMLSAKGRVLKLLQQLNSTFYKGTNGVLIPEVSIIVINLDIVEKKHLKAATKEILKELKPINTPTAIFDLMVVINNRAAIPCFKKEYSDALSELLRVKAHAELLIKK